MFATRIVLVADGGTKKYLVAAMVDAGVNDFSEIQSFGQKTNAPVNLAQASFAVNVVTILRAVPVGRGPVNDFDDLRPLGINELQQLLAYTLIAFGG